MANRKKAENDTLGEPAYEPGIMPPRSEPLIGTDSIMRFSVIDLIDLTDCIEGAMGSLEIDISNDNVSANIRRWSARKLPHLKALHARINGELEREPRLRIGTPKKSRETFAQATERLLDLLEAKRWKVKRGLKVPWACEGGPYNVKLFFRPQAIYMNGHSLVSDRRDLTIEQLDALIRIELGYR